MNAGKVTVALGAAVAATADVGLDQNVGNSLPVCAGAFGSISKKRQDYGFKGNIDFRF